MRGLMKLELLMTAVALVFLAQAGCASRVEKAVRDVKYSAYEAIGMEKRDLFKSKLSEVKQNQDESKGDITDALTQLKKVYGFDGGNLEREYNRLKSANDSAKKSAGEVTESIRKLETVAGDLFVEWSKEITEITSPDLRTKSQGKLQATQKKYNAYIAQLKKSEAKIPPVLTKFNDQVLFLKHNLNAAAITGLKAEGTRIESDINKVIEEMNQSISQADELIKTL